LASRNFFSAENTSKQSIVGHPTFNVTPLQTGVYFHKIQCSCFTEERLEPHQKVDMHVVFLIDPAFDKDDELRTIDIAYLKQETNARLKTKIADGSGLLR
jgi:cytochrome c oxidase assembly protein subunit 11